MRTKLISTQLTHPDTIYYRSPIDNQNDIRNGRSQDRCDKFERNQLYFRHIRLCLRKVNKKNSLPKQLIFTTIRRIVAIYSHLCLKFIFLSRMLFALFRFKKYLQFIFYSKYTTFEIFRFFFSKNKRMINPSNFGKLIGK